MRSLDTSLPTPYSNRPVPPEHLLQAFKSAALSVTNLYKSAVQDQNNNRAAGYQDALDDLLRFLDSENLGLQDGEGWRVRQWVTERYDGTANQPTQESEDEKSEPETHQQREVNITQPAQEQTSSQAEVMQHNVESRQQNDTRAASADPDSTTSFKFSYPSETSTMLADRGLGIETEPSTSSPVSEPEHTSTGPIQIINRGGRPHRNNTFRQNSRATNRHINSTVGTKRKNPWPDVNFFDMANLGPKDGPGPDAGNKRGRYV